MFLKESIYNTIKNTIDMVIIFFTCILCIKKGGYYISDSEFYINYIIILFLIYIINEVFNYFNKKKNNIIDKNNKNIEITKKNKYIIILLAFMLVISYCLPIIFNMYLDYTEAIYEMLKYFVFFIIIYIISNSNNKKIYLITIIILGLIQTIFGIDGISNRVFSDTLKNVNSGYLSKDLDRLSGTIQYANLAGLIFTISSIILLKYLNNLINKIKFSKDKIITEISKNNKIKMIILNVFFILFTLCILLTKSKMILILYLISLLVIFIKNRTCAKLNIIVNTVIAFLASANVENLIYIDNGKIYVTVLSYIVLSIIITNIIIKNIFLNNKLINYYLNLKYKIIENIKIKKNKRIFIIIFILILVVSFIILMGLKTDLTLTNQSKIATITRTYYNLNNEYNNFNIKFDTKTDSSFYITVYGINKDNTKTYIEKHSLSDKSNINDCNIKVNNKDYKAIMLEFSNVKGYIKIEEIILNGKTKVIEYLLLPTDLIFRINDVIHFNSTSVTDRVEYNKDALKIWNESKLIGFGGEAFRHKYKEVQTYNYSSREVHNVYLQILVESGIIGFVIIITIVILTLKIKTDVYVKLCFIIFCIHNIVDLNFSYLIGVIIFAILIGYILNNKKNLKHKP